MNMFVTTALGLVAVGSIGNAGTGDSDWLGLDSEISGLATSLKPATGDGSGWAALLRATYNLSSDDIATGGGADISGFVLDDVNLAFWGAYSDFGLRVSADIDSGSNFELEDAYASFRCGNNITARMGMFKAPVLRSAAIDPENTLFLDRTVLGSAFDGWDTGISVEGGQSGLNWSFALQNGDTNTNVDHRYSLRLSYDLGLGAGSSEGARGGNDELNATAGLAIVSDDTIQGDTQSIFLDFNGNFGAIGFGADIGLIDDDVTNLGVTSDFGVGNASAWTLDPDSSPYSLTFSYLLNPEIELGLRLEDLDNSLDESILTLGVNYYRPGNNSKWSASYSDVDSDGADGSYVQVGLTVGRSR